MRLERNNEEQQEVSDASFTTFDAASRLGQGVGSNGLRQGACGRVGYLACGDGRRPARVRSDPDRVIQENIADLNTATVALKAGEIDFFELPLIGLLPQLQNAPNIKIMVLNGSGNVGVARLNCLHPPFGSV